VPIHQNMHSNQSFTREIFVNENDPINDVLNVAEVATVFVHSLSNRLSKLHFKKIFANILKSLFYAVLHPIVLVFALVIYITLAPILRVFFYRRKKKIAKLNNEIQLVLQSGHLTKKDLIESHGKIKSYIDLHAHNLSKLDGEPIFRPALQAYLSELKKIEVFNRVAAYPERNEVVLTYDELYELNHLTDLSF
jgi:hypothetical protein